MNTTLVFGTGPLGMSVMDELVRQGIPVTLVNRSGRVAESLPPTVRVVAADLTEARQVAALMRDAQTVFVCVNAAYTRWLLDFPPLLAGISGGMANSPAVLVFGDNVYGYGDTNGQPMHEGMPQTAHTRKGKLRADLSEGLVAAHRRGTLRTVIGRGSDFYGPRVNDAFLGKDFFKAVLAGKKALMPGDIHQPHTHTFISDFGRGLVTLSQHPEAWGQLWHIPNAPTVSTADVLLLLETELGHPVRTQRIGRLPITIGSWFSPLMREFLEMLYEFEKPFIINHEKFERAFGNTATPLAEGLRQTLAWYRAAQADPAHSVGHKPAIAAS